jgi:hypothetical protein
MQLPTIRPPRPRFSRVGLVVLLVVIVVVCWQRFFPPPTVREICQRSYESYVRDEGETDLPKSAHDIRFVWADCGLAGHARVCRFEGPLEDLRAYAIAEANRRAPAADKAPRLVKLTEPPSQPDLTAYGIRPLIWFDVERIEEGLVLDRTDKRQPFTWIDTRRKVLYSYGTD